MIAGVSMAGAPFDGPEAADGSLPLEFFGFVLGEKIDAVNAPGGGVIVKSRTMEVVKGNDFAGSPRGPDVTTYKDCPLRFANKCVWEADVAGQRPDDPGSLTLFVSGAGEGKLLGLGFKLNPRVWRSIPLEKGDERLRKIYGSPVKTSPPRQETFTVKATGAQFVSASASWQWQDGVVRLSVSGDGRHLPGSFGNPDPLFTYVLYVERIDLRRLVDERAQPGGSLR
jgi:hypothetical protein